MPRWLKWVLGTVAVAGAGALLLSGRDSQDVDQDADAGDHVDTHDVDALGLVGPAYSGAHTLKQQRPQTVFSSGRRDRGRQASAMAVNGAAVAAAHNVPPVAGMLAYVQGDKALGVRAVHSASRTRTRLVAMLQQLDSFAPQQEIAHAIAAFFDTLTDAEIAELTRHLGGLAFDVRPEFDEDGNIDTDARNEVKTIVSALPRFKRWLDKEADQDRWHAEFWGDEEAVA